MKKPHKPKPTQPKVVAAALGVASVSPFVLWLTGVLLFGAPSDSIHADAAMRAVPWQIATLEGALLAGLFGWLKRDTQADR